MTIEEFLIGNGYELFFSKFATLESMKYHKQYFRKSVGVYIHYDPDELTIEFFGGTWLKPYFKKMIPHLFEGYFVK